MLIECCRPSLGWIIFYLFTEFLVQFLATAQAGCETPQVQLQKYIVEMQENVQYPNALNYWTGHYSTYNRLADTALDLLAAPASQAYVERVFSVCGMLTQGRRNRMTQSLDMRARLKLNFRQVA